VVLPLPGIVRSDLSYQRVLFDLQGTEEIGPLNMHRIARPFLVAADIRICNGEGLNSAYSSRAQATDVLAGFRFIKEGDIPVELRLASVQL
jgi:hypothetical protein